MCGSPRWSPLLHAVILASILALSAPAFPDGAGAGAGVGGKGLSGLAWLHRAITEARFSPHPDGQRNVVSVPEGTFAWQDGTLSLSGAMALEGSRGTIFSSCLLLEGPGGGQVRWVPTWRSRHACCIRVDGGAWNVMACCLTVEGYGDERAPTVIESAGEACVEVDGCALRGKWVPSPEEEDAQDEEDLRVHRLHGEGLPNVGGAEPQVMP
ncbi:hypothetical protein T484DRAFT_1884334 [Baffinella frigidus]|nr:hypothetical protein T484DRAFT_1884334 [Cryptophyta sp. CCMP2293]